MVVYNRLPMPYETQQVNPHGGCFDPYNFDDGKIEPIDFSPPPLEVSFKSTPMLDLLKKREAEDASLMRLIEKNSRRLEKQMQSRFSFDDD